MPRIVIRKGVAAGRDHALGGMCVVGRHPSADFVLEDHLCSRRHFQIAGGGGAWVLEDLGSTNGTLVNGQKVSRQPLLDGDVIRVGSTELVFVQKDLLDASQGKVATPRTRKARAAGRGEPKEDAKGGIPPRKKRFLR